MFEERDIDSGWVGPHEVVWSLTFPDGQEPPKRIVEDIRKFFRGYVPLWCTRVFTGPDGVKETFQYHVIGMWRQTPDEDCPDFHRIIKGLALPFDFPFRGGVIYEQRTLSLPWPDGSWQKARMTPDIPMCCMSSRTEAMIAERKHRCIAESIPRVLYPGDGFVLDGYERITKPPAEMHWERTRDWIAETIRFTQLIGDTFEARLDKLRRARIQYEEDEEKRIDEAADYKIKSDGLLKKAIQNGWWAPLPRDMEPWAPKPFVHVRAS